MNIRTSGVQAQEKSGKLPVDASWKLGLQPRAHGTAEAPACGRVSKRVSAFGRRGGSTQSGLSQMFLYRTGFP
jgi:hypothetical protein